jgi:hypothetical protein
MLALVGLAVFPSLAAAQRAGLPRGRATRPEPASLPPQAPPVAHALSYHRARWSAEAYSLVSSLQTPNVNGGASRYNTLGLGSRADLRVSNRFSVTLDATTSMFGGPATTRTGEVGTRFSPLDWNRRVRPFVDLRAAYMHLADSYATPSNPSGGVGGPNQQLVELGRYSRGFGTVAGAGFELSIAPSFAITNEISGLRARMTTYRLSGPTDVPPGASYWTTTLRYALGLKFNPTRVLQLAQNPRQ